MAFDSKIRELIIAVKFAVDSSEMGKIDKNINHIKRKMETLGSTQRIKQSFRGVTSMATRMGVAFGAASTGLGFFLNEAGQANKTRIAFETMTGSIEKGRALYKDLQRFALETPFTLEDVEKNSAMLLGMGIETKKVIPTMKALGDVAAGINRPLAMVALNFGQIRTRGVLMGTELRDFARQGVPIIQELSKMLGVAESQIQKMTTKREITFEQVEQAFINMTSEGGRFNDLMMKQAKTWPVLWSNFVIRLRLASRAIGNALLPTAKKYLIILSEWIDLNRKLIQDTLIKSFKTVLIMIKRLGLFIRDTLPRIRELIRIFGGLHNIIKMITIAFVVLLGLKIAVMIGTLAIGIGSLIGAMFGVASAAAAMNIVLGFIPALIGIAIVALALFTEDLIAFFRGQDSLIGRYLKSWLNWKNALRRIFNFATILTPWTAFANILTKLITGKTLGTWLVEGFQFLMSDPVMAKVNKIIDWFDKKTGLSKNASASDFNTFGGFGTNPYGGFPGLNGNTRASDVLTGSNNPALSNTSNNLSRNVIQQENNFNFNGANDPKAVETVQDAVWSPPRDLIDNTSNNFSVVPVSP